MKTMTQKKKTTKKKENFPLRFSRMMIKRNEKRKKEKFSLKEKFHFDGIEMIINGFL